MASASVALINLLTAMLVSARKAKAAGDNAALFVYIDVLDVGLAEARDNGVDLPDELTVLDPYSLWHR